MPSASAYLDSTTALRGCQPNSPIERTCPGKPGQASHVVRWASESLFHISSINSHLMSKARLITSIVFASSLTACITAPQPTVVQTRMPFDGGQTLAALGKGNNTIKGSALLRQQGGGVVTCAGTEVILHPVTNYSAERISSLYGSYDGGYRPAIAGGVVFEPNNEVLYRSATRRVLCDAQGYFKFDELLDGDFYVVASVVWRVGHAPQGGGILRKVSVKNGEVKEIVLSAN